jgi:hypothetical protein
MLIHGIALAMNRCDPVDAKAVSLCSGILCFCLVLDNLAQSLGGRVLLASEQSFLRA